MKTQKNNQKKTLKLVSRHLVVSALVLSQLGSVTAGANANLNDESYRQKFADFALKVRKSNNLINSWLINESKNVSNFLDRRGQQHGPNEDFDLHTMSENEKVSVRPPSETEMKTAIETKELADHYYSYQGEKRFVGAFIESGAPYSDGYQWNTQRWQGLMVPELRNKLLDRAVEQGLMNIRFGINTQDVDFRRPETIQPIVDTVTEMWKRGISPTLSVFFFPSLANLRTLDQNGKVIAEKSYQNHPDYPKYAEQLTDSVLSRVYAAADKFNAENSQLPVRQRKPMAQIAINEVNEPETDVGFNHFWRDALAKWSDPHHMRLYIPAIINTAKAKVRIRIASERAAKGKKILYFHNEAMTPPDYPSHKGDGQFAISKLMLGDDMLMNADLNQLRNEPIDQIKARFEANKAKGVVNVVEWTIIAMTEVPLYDTPEKKESARQQIVSSLEELKGMHNELKAKTGITAKDRTILMLDYYQQSEFILSRKLPEIVKDLAKDNGLGLKTALKVKDDASAISVLRERAMQAEQATGTKIWPDREPRTLADLDLTALLTVEDGIVLDKVVGLRNDFVANKESPFVERRTAVGLKTKNLDELQQRDERRIDPEMNKLVANDAALLKSLLNVQTDAELRTALQQFGEVSPTASIRDVLNYNQREILNKFLGLSGTKKLGFLPPHYARQTRLNLRKGLYKSTITYINELGVRVGGIGESGTPYYPWSATVHKQMFMAMAAAARKAHFSFVRYDLGPLVGTIGWMAGPLIRSFKENSRRSEDGIFKIVRTGKKQFDYVLSQWQQDRPWFKTFTEDLYGGIAAQQRKIDAKNAERAQQERAQEAKSGGAIRTCEAIFRKAS